MKRSAAILLLFALLLTGAFLLHREPSGSSPRKSPLWEAAVEPLPPEPGPLAVAPEVPKPAPEPLLPPSRAAPVRLPEPSVFSVPGTAILRGTVKVLGEPPPRKKIRMDADPHCVALHASNVLSDALVVDRDGGVRWAFVYIVSGINNQPPKRPLPPVLLDQVGCMFEPHVLGLQTGQPLNIFNTDGILHNAHSFAFANRAFNFGLVDKSTVQTLTLDKPEVMFSIRCDIHPWMRAWIGVLDHPFFCVTNETGSYALPQLPAGRYTVQVWHETYATVAREVDVLPDGDVTLDFILDARKQ